MLTFASVVADFSRVDILDPWYKSVNFREGNSAGSRYARILITLRPDVSCSRNQGRVRAKKGQLKTFQGLLQESRGQNLALPVSYVPYSLDSGVCGFRVGRSVFANRKSWLEPSSYEGTFCRILTKFPLSYLWDVYSKFFRKLVETLRNPGHSKPPRNLVFGVARRVEKGSVIRMLLHHLY